MKRGRGTSTILILAFSLFTAACGQSTTGDQKLGRLETEVIRVNIDGQQFDVPLRYMYGDAIAKLGGTHWPEAKKERVKVDYIHISLLMPDMKPYFFEDDARWKDRTYGGRIQVALAPTDGQGGWFGSMLRRTDKDAQLGLYYRKEADKYGLIYFASSTQGDEYFSQEGRRLAISCDSATKKDPRSCHVKSAYRDGLAFEYYLHQKYLPQWQQIDDKLKSLFDQFSGSAQVNSDK